MNQIFFIFIAPSMHMMIYLCLIDIAWHWIWLWLKTTSRSW